MTIDLFSREIRCRIKDQALDTLMIGRGKRDPGRFHPEDVRERLDSLPEFFELEEKAALQLAFGLGDGQRYNPMEIAEILHYQPADIEQLLDDSLKELFPKKEFSYLFN